MFQLQSQWGESPVLFLPSHRSYGDFVLMAFLCFNYSIEIPCVAAGMDFQSMYLMSSMLRDCSAFFMRRSYGQDKLYWRVFNLYVQHLVTDNVAPLEFFIEGTRSRTGKSLYPKLGLLSMVLNPVINHQVTDLLIVPVSISYDRALEENLFACELLGIPKPKESTSGFIKAVNTLNEQYGSIYMDFANPISARQFLSTVDSGLHSNITLCLGHEVLRRQQQISVLSLFNVLSILLSYQHITFPHFSYIPLDQASKFLTWFSAVLEKLGALVDVPKGGVGLAIKESVIIHNSLVSIIQNENREEVLCPCVTKMNFTTLDASKLKGHRLEEHTMKNSVTWMSIQNYSNPCTSLLIDPAIVCILLLKNQGMLDKGTLLRQFIQMRLIFLYEFVFYPPLAEQFLSSAISYLQSIDLVDVTSDICLIQSDHSKYLCSVFISMLYPFVSGYYVACSVLLDLESKQAASSSYPDKIISKTIQSRVETLLLSQSLHHPYPLSLDLISCCLSSLTHQKALSRVKRNNIAEYIIHKEPLLLISDELNQVLSTLLKHLPNHKEDIRPHSGLLNRKSKL